MLVHDFVKTFIEKKIVDTKINEHAVSDYLKKELEIKTYIPFRDKKGIAEAIVSAYTEEVDGIKKHDSLNAYIGFVAASIMAHTNLQFGPDPIADYDLLAESGLLSKIIVEFQESHNEIDILLKMALASELEDNNINVLVGRFLANLSGKIDVIGDAIRNKIDNLNVVELFGSNINNEDMAKLIGLLNKLK